MTRIVRNIGLQKYGEGLAILLHTIDKKQLLAGDIENIESLVDVSCLELKSSGVIYPLNISISDYGVDPRHLAQIPEVVAWFRKVHEAYPYLPIFLSPFILHVYLLSQLDTEVVETVGITDLTAEEKKEVDFMAAILNNTEPGLGEEYRKQMEFKTKFKVNMQQVQELNAQINFAAGLYLRSHILSEVTREKALKDAFERINLALDFS